jgi:cytochrome P450 family 4
MLSKHRDIQVRESIPCKASYAQRAHWLLFKKQISFQEKVLMEQKEIFGDSDHPLTTRDIHSMEYLEMVIKETFRLYPPVPIIGRKLKKDFDVGE